MTETTRIRWTEHEDTAPGYGTFPGWTGHVGSRREYLFLISKRSLGSEEYALSTELPWMRRKRSYGPDPRRTEGRG